MNIRRIRATRLRMLFASLGVCAAISGAVLLLAHSSGAGSNFDATSAFSVFRSLPASAPPAEIANSPDLSSRAETSETRLLGSGLGRFQSSLVIFPGNNHQNVCFGLVASDSADPGMAYCYSPGPSAPPAVAGEDFSVAAPESVTNGTVGVQLFGVADDNVASARVQVAGRWRALPVAKNGFYIDLPGVSYDQIGHFEATLKNGSIQIHDVKTDTRIS